MHSHNRSTVPASGLERRRLASVHSHDDPRAESSAQAESRVSDSRNSMTGNSTAGDSTTGSTPVGVDHLTNENGTPNSKSRLSGSLRKRQRDSGGFLLGSSFGRRKGLDTSETRRRSKGKERSDRYSDDSSFGHNSPSPGYTPSPSATPAKHGQAKRPQHAGLGLEIVGLDGSTTIDEEADRSPPRPQTQIQPAGSQLDPTQLVQMALSLNEGRRRHASAGLNIPTGNADTRRVRSAGAAQANVPPGSPLGNDRNVSSGRSDYTHIQSPSATFGPHGDHYQAQDPEHDYADPPVNYQFSAATLARAEKTRTFFELSNEYYRFLDYLPPMRPNQSSSIDSLALGRQYNPLQCLRNKRTRMRERRPLLPAPVAFEDVTQVREWLDDVEDSLDSTDNLADTTSIPAPAFASLVQERNVSGPHSGKGHRRTETATSKMEWTESGWNITPMELFADTLWSEDPENRHLLEDRRGRKVFAALPRISVERRATLISESPPVVRSRGRSVTVGSADIADAESNPHQPSKRRKFLSIHRVEDDVIKRLPWHRRRSMDSLDDSDVSDVAVRQKSPRINNVGGENIGPLARHMQEMMDKEGARGSPELISPAKWDSMPKSAESDDPRKIGANVTSTDIPNTMRRQRPRALDLRKSRSFSEGLGHKTSASRPVSGATLDADSPVPDTPALKTAVPMMGMKLSPPHTGERSFPSWSPQKLLGRSSRQSSPERPLTTETADFAPGASTTSFPRPTDEDASDRMRKSFDSWTRPAFLTKRKTNDTFEDSDVASNGQPKETNRGMSRLLKAGRIGNLVRNESSRISDRLRRKDQDDPAKRSEVSGDESDLTDGEDDQASKRASTEISRSDQRPEKQKYHAPLPTFRSTNSVEDMHSTDPITQQQVARKAQSRFNLQNRLPLSRIVVPGSDRGKPTGTETGEDDKSESASATHRRGNSVRLFLPKRTRSTMTANQGSGGKSSIVVPGTRDGGSLAKSDSDKEKQAFARGKRHWSIADQSKIQTANEQVVTTQDVARVKALFLSSGIKAHELCLRTSAINDVKPSYLVAAAEKSGEDISHVTRRHEFVVAAELWSRLIDKSLSTSQTKLEDFRKKSAHQTRPRIEQLRQKAAEQLTMRVNETSDEADAFTYDLNTHQTLAVKQVNDAIDEMVRKRRRNLRMVKRVGFTLLEWVLLGVMWWLWFVVVVWRFVKNIILSIVGTVRWVLWI